MPLSDPGSLIQVAYAGLDAPTGAGTHLTAAFAQPAAAGNSVFFFWVLPMSCTFSGPKPLPFQDSPLSSNVAGFDPDNIVGGAFSGYLVTDTASWDWAIDASILPGPPATVPMCWLMVEVSGFSPYWPGTPWVDSGWPVEAVTLTGNSAADNSGTAVTLATGTSTLTTYGTMLMFAMFCSRRKDGLAPQGVNSLANTVSQPGSWAPLGAFTATSNGADDIGMDIAYKIVHQDGMFGCSAIWPAATGKLNCTLGGSVSDTFRAARPVAWTTMQTATS